MKLNLRPEDFRHALLYWRTPLCPCDGPAVLSLRVLVPSERPANLLSFDVIRNTHDVRRQVDPLEPTVRQSIEQTNPSRSGALR